MAHAEPIEVDVLVYGAELVSGGVDDFGAWAEDVARQFPGHDLSSQLRSLYTLSRELRFHPADQQREVATQMLAHRRVAGTGPPEPQPSTDTPVPEIVFDGPVERVAAPDTSDTSEPYGDSPDAVIVGPRGSPLALVMSGLVCFVIASVIISGEARFYIYIVAALIASSVFAQVRQFVRPPQIGVRDGVFSVRLGSSAFQTPVANVAGLGMSAGRVGIVFHDLARVSPAGLRPHLAQQYEAAEVHLVIPDRVFSLDEVNCVREALGFPRQQSDDTPREGTDLLSLLTAATPHVWVTPTIVAANVVLFLALCVTTGSFEAADTEVALAWGANSRELTIDGGQWWRLLTAMFFHFGVIHIALNMYVLWQLGDLVERLVGNVAFAISYVVAGVAGSVASVLWTNAPGAGASGAIFGVFGLVVGFLSLHRKSIPPAAVKRLRNTVLTCVAICLLFGFSVDFVGNAAHIGGLIAGFFCGLLLSQDITPDKLPGRKVRTALLAVGGAAVCVALVLALPRLPVRYTLGMRMGDLNRSSVEILNATRDQMRQGQLSPEEAGERLETEIVAEHELLLRDLRQKLDSQPMNPGVFEKLIATVALRLEGWTMIARATATNDLSLEDEGFKKLVESEAVLPRGEEDGS